MGAWTQRRERRIERRLASEATKGVVAPLQAGLDRLGAPDLSSIDRRALVPPLGLREYWYPLIEASQVPKNKPVYWRIAGEELAVFRDGSGGVAATSDVCPHRGASLSQGKCFYEGTVACPYHGAVFDASGECKAFLTEGPDSTMVGALKVRSYPTKTLRGWVFVWMGEGEPAPIEEDVPPEFFQSDSTVLFSTYTYWPTSWIVAIENQNDAHNCLFAHRNSLMQLTADRSRRRTPRGPRSKVVNDRALVPLMENQVHYADETGEVPFQMHYPGVDGFWPKTRWRQRLWKLMSPLYKYVIYGSTRQRWLSYFTDTPEEWAALGPQRSALGRRMGGASCWHLPCAVRVNFGYFMYTRYAVPVSENLSRVIYFHSRHTRRPITRLLLRGWFRLYFNYWLHYNFSGQDNKVASPTRYWTPEYLAPTDSHLILLRKLITERSRDAALARERGVDTTFVGETEAELHSYRLQSQLGLEPERHLREAAAETAGN